jgi:predicted CXXCH cytochrome family protein
MFIIIPLKKLKLDYKKLFFFFMVVVLIYLSGCSSAYRYKTLSFFFDGVPNPATELNNQSKDTIINVKTSDVFAQNPTSKLPPKMNFHAPYQDKACESCHDQSKMGKLNKDMPELCYQCHENLNNKYKVLHSPVEGGQCIACHNPHSSVNENLLLRTGQSLCLYCHDSKQIMETDVHLEIGEANCTDCHNPHGGEDRNVLR